ncbi:MAG: phosphatase PAP2 family protein [Povalibacter sp.]
MPLACFVVLAAVFATSSLDVNIAHAFFDSASDRWIGADNWWVTGFIHHGGQWFLRSIVAVAAVTYAMTFFKDRLRYLRRPSAFIAVSLILSIGIVGLLKTVTNVHCPWSLTEFGGDMPYLHLFTARPQSMTHGHCFPAAHSSSGYALIAFYFLFRERNQRLARIGFVAAVITGLVFGIAQQSRGAHFVSHDIWSAFLVWLISLSVYAFAFKARLWDAPGEETIVHGTNSLPYKAASAELP